MGDGLVKFLKWLFLLLLILKWDHSALATQGLVINEVLANEPGGLTKLEWVEFFNLDSIEINLEGWKFVCKSDTTLLEGILIPRNEYLVLVRELLSFPPDSNSFEAYWGDASGVWGDAVREGFLAIEVSMSLTNRGGTISLIDPEYNVSSFTWNKDWGDGISWEKIDPAKGDSSENWSRCWCFKGSTPGLINSVTPAPNDLALQAEDISVVPENPKEFEYFEVKVRVRNTGTQRSLPNKLIFFCDYDFDSQLQIDEVLGETQAIIPVDVDHHLDFSVELSFPRGNYRIYAEIEKDDKNYNNTALVDVRVGSEIPELIINEFMCSPDLTQPEWVELFNRSGSVICLENWYLGDSIEQNLITSEDIDILSSDYLIVTENLAEFYSAHPEAGCQVVEQREWRTLNNAGDKIMLRDNLQFIIDQISYTEDWGKGISWERVDPEKTSSDSDNWWRSVDPIGATPCKMNSLVEGYSEEVGLNIEPNPFSPDGDGFEDEVRFEYAVPLKSELTLKIYDVKGRSVKTLLDQEPKASGQIAWDGKNDQGRTVRAGIYVVFLEAKVASRKLVKKTTVVVAKR